MEVSYHAMKKMQRSSLAARRFSCKRNRSMTRGSGYGGPCAPGRGRGRTDSSTPLRSAQNDTGGVAAQAAACGHAALRGRRRRAHVGMRPYGGRRRRPHVGMRPYGGRRRRAHRCAPLRGAVEAAACGHAALRARFNRPEGTPTLSTFHCPLSTVNCAGRCGGTEKRGGLCAVPLVFPLFRSRQRAPRAVWIRLVSVSPSIAPMW